MKNAYSKNKRGLMYQAQKGQALVTMLFFVIIAITITSAAVVIILINSLSGTKFQESSIAYEIAQSGIDNAELQLLRNTNYTGEVLPVGGGTATITVTNNNGTYTILSKGQNGNFIRQIQVTATYVNNVFTVTSQQELF